MSHQQATSKPASHVISRKARIWPEIPQEKVLLPGAPQLPQGPQVGTLSFVLFNLLGMGLYVLIFSTFKIGGGAQFFLLPFIAISGMMALGTVANFLTQHVSTKRKSKTLMERYEAQLQEVEQRLQGLHWKERQARLDLDPPLLPPRPEQQVYQGLSIVPLIERGFDEQDTQLWARKPDDPDFLTVRIGMGSQPATYEIQAPPTANTFPDQPRLEASLARVQALQERHNTLKVPITVKLNEPGPIALVGTRDRLEAARELLQAMVCQLVYHHSPEEVRIIILTPRSQEQAWRWATALPHTVLYDPRQAEEVVDESNQRHAVAIGAGAILEHLPLISRELGRRELLLGDTRREEGQHLLPHLIIVVDHFDLWQDLDQPSAPQPVVSPHNSIQRTGSLEHRPQLSVSPLKRPEMTLALSGPTTLGVSVLCLCAHKADVPMNSNLLVDITHIQDDKQAGKGSYTLQAQVRQLCPNPPPAITCDEVDGVPLQALSYFSQRMFPLHVNRTKRLELRTQVDLRTLFEPPLDLLYYDPFAYWSDPMFRGRDAKGKEMPMMRIPIGTKIGDEIQYLDLLKDGPHGLLIGQTGSGKSELLQTIIMALSIIYRPNEVNFLLIDYKAGLALEPFRHLPHTIGFLSNVSSPALIQRFITMLRAEAMRREIRLKEGKKSPRLIIIIDEFAEMAKQTDSVLDELFTITRVGREIGMHLLLASQRPEGIIATRVRDYVQYRLCLRCASPEDSREILRRVDAAYLPASIPGRGYLLHGDNQLDLFQAARVSIPVTLDQLYVKPNGIETPVDPTNDVLIAQLAAEK